MKRVKGLKLMKSSSIRLSRLGDPECVSERSKAATTEHFKTGHPQAALGVGFYRTVDLLTRCGKVVNVVRGSWLFGFLEETPSW